MCLLPAECLVNVLQFEILINCLSWFFGSIQNSDSAFRSIYCCKCLWLFVQIPVVSNIHTEVSTICTDKRKMFSMKMFSIKTFFSPQENKTFHKLKFLKGMATISKTVLRRFVNNSWAAKHEQKNVNFFFHERQTEKKVFHENTRRSFSSSTKNNKIPTWKFLLCSCSLSTFRLSPMRWKLFGFPQELC